MSTSGMLGIGVSGLLAFQRSLQTVSHNIANSTTEGYTRQRVELGTQTPWFIGGSYIGTGVTLQGVERVYDNFLVGQVRTYTSSSNQATTYSSYSSRVDEMLADPNIGLMPAIEDFFASVHDVSNDPLSLPAREAMVTQGETLVDRFQYLDNRYEELRTQVNQAVSDNAAEINSLAQEIADLNRNIVLAPGQGAPNDLLDERDRLLNKLAERVSITTVEQDNGSINVFFGKGQILVLDFESRELSVTRNQYDVSQYEVSIDTGGGTLQEVTSQISGGELGGLFDFRDNVLAPAQNSMGALAIGISDTFNAQHRLGQDLDGILGGDFFKTPGLQVLPGPASATSVTATLSDSTQLTNSDYMLRYDGVNYTLTRNSDNTTVLTGSPATFATTPVDGFTLNIGAGGVAGDSYLIRPSKTAVSQLDLTISDARQVAAAAPILAEATIGNLGTGSISPGVITNVSTTVLPNAGGFTLTYDAFAGGFNITGTTAAGGAVTPITPPVIPYVDGGTILINDPGDGTGIEVVIRGMPQNGDTFTIKPNTGGVSDNRNALLLSGLQTKRLLDNGNASYDEYYGSMVAEVGIKTNQAQIIDDSQARLLEQAMSARDALSGVNLDEEAANLVKFQQAYQAAAQVINVTGIMFDSLIAAVRG